MYSLIHNRQRNLGAVAGRLRKIRRTPAGPRWLFLGAVVLWAALAANLTAQTTVRTLGGGFVYAGGPFQGDRDGDTLQNSQFNSPWACALDTTGQFLYVADRDNGKVRRLDIAGNQTRTYLAGLNQPIGVAVDSTNHLYVLNQGDGTLLQYNERFRLLTLVATNLNQPTAMVMLTNGDFYVTELGGNLKRIPGSNNANVTTIAAGFREPRGIARLDSGMLAVSEAAANSLRLIDPVSFATVGQIGASGPGPDLQDGPIAIARFKQPHQLAKAPNGSLVIVDRGNQRVRFLTPDGLVETLYGIDPAQWETGPGLYPGWADGDIEFAEAREPEGVTVGVDGTVYTTEVYYHLVREITGAGFGAGAGAGTGTNSFVLEPQFSPMSGFYPFGQTITVINPNTNIFFFNRVFYTTDGSEPTTNSQEVVFTAANQVGAVGYIYWRENLRDLTSLRLKAFVGDSSSATVSGQPAAINNIGVPRDLQAGIGATIVVPVVLNLRPGDQVKSLQFRMEIVPQSLTAPAITGSFEVLNYTGSFIPVAGPTPANSTTIYSTIPYQIGNTRGLVVTLLGTNANFAATRFGAAVLLKLPIPPTAHADDRYEIRVLEPSGTSDAQQTSTPLMPLPNRTITVTNVAYMVGDSSLGTGFNAGEFGDGVLNNADVNSAFLASLGIDVPLPFTDVYDAMDAYPLDSAGVAGGDGLIRYLDWQTILYRSLRIDTNNWKRSWAAGGIRRPVSANSTFAANLPAVMSSAPVIQPAWFREALVGALPVDHVNAGAIVDVPVYLRVALGCQVAGLQFRATIQPENAAPTVQLPADFVTAPAYAGPTLKETIGANEVLCTWSISAFGQPLQSSNLLGHIRFKVPDTARSGQNYTVKFSYVDGAADFSTPYNFESLPASVWIQSPALSPPETISDEWKTSFFGSPTSALAAMDADPDGDGFSNAVEYQAGLNPNETDWRYRVEQDNFVIRWFAAAGHRYEISQSADLVNWDVVGTVEGNNQLRSFSAPRSGKVMQGFRVLEK